jgi:Zn-finger nucleic acid-binding protein
VNCLNCGAPLELVEGREVLTCRFCNSYRQIQVNEQDGDRVVAFERTSEFTCPRCWHQLVEAGLDGYNVDHCPQCRGLLMDNATFAIVTRNRRSKYRGPELPAQPINPKRLQEFVDCPQCGDRMDVHPNYGPGQAVIDSCEECDLVWLDSAEMTSIERTPGRR